MARPEDHITEHIIARMQSDASVDAPADAVAYAKNLFRTRAIETAPSMLRQIIAVLTADLAPGRPAFGERSGAGAAERQMMFEADDNAVDIRVTQDAGSIGIRGQVLGDGFEAGEIALIRGDSRLTAAIDDMGGFSLGDVPAGTYRVTLSGHDREVVIEEMQVG